jgi:hypothetical protein
MSNFLGFQIHGNDDDLMLDHDLQDCHSFVPFPGLFLVGITRKGDKFLRPRTPRYLHASKDLL